MGERAGSRARASSTMGELTAQAETIDRETPVVFYCRVGGAPGDGREARSGAPATTRHDDRGPGRVGGPGAAAGARRWACSGSLIALACVRWRPPQAAPELVEGRRLRQSPTYATGAPGDAAQVFVTEAQGVVRLVRDGTVLRNRSST